MLHPPVYIKALLLFFGGGGGGVGGLFGALLGGGVVFWLERFCLFFRVLYGDFWGGGLDVCGFWICYLLVWLLVGF